MMEYLIELDDLLREFWEGIFEDFPFDVLFAFTLVLAWIMLII